MPRPLPAVVALIAALAAPLPVVPAALAGGVLRGETFARLSVTVDPDETGTIVVPSPFTVVPASRRTAIYVPESDGIFLVEGERILHHFPDAAGEEPPDDLDATRNLLVAGRRSDEPYVTAELRIYDLRTGRNVTSFRSRNPNLRVPPEVEELWRVVVGPETAGVYDPGVGASFPLWTREEGPLASSAQMERASTGIGFGGRTKVMPLADGSVSIRHGTHTEPFAGPDEGDFVDAVPGGGVLFLQPAVAVRSDSDGDVLLPPEQPMRLLDEDGRPTDFRLRALDRGVKAARLVIRGRAVRVRGSRVYWIFLGADFLEIRSAELSEIARPGS
jgi:hypothetical protein